MRRAVLLFVKYPEPGRVKTRIAATAGNDQAAQIYRQLVAAVCAQLPAGAALRVLFDPPSRHCEVQSWILSLLAARPQSPQSPQSAAPEFLPQAGGDLGERLSAGFQQAFAAGFDQVAAIGSDCVDLDAATFAALWTALESADCVLGPASDGGYYLIGLRQFFPQLFTGIAWSTDSVKAQTLECAARNGLNVQLLTEKCDVDTEEDWHRARARIPSETFSQRI